MFETWFAQYNQELFGRTLLTFESGFIVYGIAAKQFYFADLFISPEFRQSSKAFAEMLGRCQAIAIEKECSHFGCRVDLNTLNSHDILQTYLKFGFRIKEVNATTLGLVKEIHG